MKKYLWVVLPILGLFLIMVLSGCGASKSYVDKAIADEHTQNQAVTDNLQKEIQTNKDFIDKLQALTMQLEKKADLAINKAKGFENYQVIWEGEIYFDFNSSAITVAAREVLDQAGDKMTLDKGSVMEISGYTDPRGSDAYNLQLGDKRANAAKYFLVDNYGVNLYRLFTVSHGKKKAVEAGDSQGSYSKQRRVTLRVWGTMQ